MSYASTTTSGAAPLATPASIAPTSPVPSPSPLPPQSYAGGAAQEYFSGADVAAAEASAPYYAAPHGGRPGTFTPSPLPSPSQSPHPQQMQQQQPPYLAPAAYGAPPGYSAGGAA